jgi:hypothetical protein
MSLIKTISLLTSQPNILEGVSCGHTLRIHTSVRWIVLIKLSSGYIYLPLMGSPVWAKSMINVSTYIHFPVSNCVTHYSYF